MSDKRIQPLPELLCPAGSPEALDAAIEGGADAVYLGGTTFNARMNAHNFGGDALRSAVLRAHRYGVKVYLTLNTLVGDREIPAALAAAEEAANAGVDALIVADLGVAAALHRTFPSLELHASTQASSHNAEAAKKLQEVGFSRIVVARETPAADLFETVKNSPLEIEMFIHGALCVSHSGQCLFSSLVGGRSGNRGECAQPCRLPFACNKGGNAYPLSLKDLSLAAHVPALIESGVASLKIEGRMKAPEYVRDTARIWRKLLDERRAATPDEMHELASIFSRGGFTDGYYKEKIDSKMLGVRSEDDKSASRTLTPFSGITRKIPLDFAVRMKENEPMTLTVSDKKRQITVQGDMPQAALTAPLSAEHLERNLSKLGGTPYSVGSFNVEMDDGLMLPVSRLNDLRRRAIAEWESNLAPKKMEKKPYVMQKSQHVCKKEKTARFYSPEQITPAAREFFDRIYLPLGKETPACDGVVLPPVIFERDLAKVGEMLTTAAAKGVRYALVGNLGHIELVKQAGLVPVGDFRLNVTNCVAVCTLEEMGIDSLILSPELTLPQARDIKGDTSLIVYGRIPLKMVEKCVIREIADCDTCDKNAAILTDRRGVRFPVLREWEHRNVIYNSLPTAMSDKQKALTEADVRSPHFLFSVESRKEVEEIIRAYQSGRPLPQGGRRI
ncbi:MAG: U32 family peptidase [Clostridia bacterium]|nr:U32 family peptidase [Clostridia bacterium]